MNKKVIFINILFAIAVGWTFSSCSEDALLQEDAGNQQQDDESVPDFDYTITS